jgi:hypothetical protein
MKKLLSVILFVFISYFGFGQGTPTASLRVATRTTPIGTATVNYPAGTHVFCISDSTEWAANVGVVGTLTLTTGRTSFTLINSPLSAGLGVSLSEGTTNITVAVDTTNASILSRQRAANTYQAKGTYVTSITAGVGINVAGTGAVPIVKVDTTDVSILSRQRAANTYQAKGTYSTANTYAQGVEVANNDSASTGHYHYILTYTPIANTITVLSNGAATTNYTVVLTNHIRTGFSLGQYDKLWVTYSH